MSKLLSRINLEMTPIVAYGLAAIFLILGGVGLGRMAGATASISERAQSAQAELYSLSKIQDTNIWEERLAISELAAAQTNQQILTGATIGVIAAELQQTLRGIASRSNLKSPQIKVNAHIEQIEGLDVVQFTFFGLAPDWGSVIDVLAALASDSHKLIVNELSFNQSRGRNGSRFSAAGIAPIKIQKAPNPQGGEQ